MNPLYLQDSYLKEFDATVTKAEGRRVTLNNTAFYPGGGGQPCDTGTIAKGGEEVVVLSVRKENGEIIHELDREGLKEGDKVHCVLDWQRRYALMRMHTAAHVFSAIIHSETGALVTGNQLGTEESRMDFALKLEWERIAEWARKANEAMAEGMEVRHYFLPREEALKIDGMVKLARATLPNVTELHVVEIGNIDREADGGTHVANTREIGTLNVTKMESKGKNNRRIYFGLK